NLGCEFAVGDRRSSDSGNLPPLQRAPQAGTTILVRLPRMSVADFRDRRGARTGSVRFGDRRMTRLVEVRRNVLKQNDLAPHELRQRFTGEGIAVVSLVSSPGSGKTAFLEKTLTMLKPRYRVAALVGDLATENDAARLARSEAPVKQIITGTV